jgi:hypothetical protein
MTDKVTCWTDPGGCSSCIYCGMDMDMGPFCSHPQVLVKYSYGVGLHTAIRDFCGPELKLYEERTK